MTVLRPKNVSTQIINNSTNSILDATKAVFPPESFDVVYSRDAIMHIAEKEPLYAKILVNIMPEIYTQILILHFFMMSKAQLIYKKLNQNIFVDDIYLNNNFEENLKAMSRFLPWY